MQPNIIVQAESINNNGVISNENNENILIPSNKSNALPLQRRLSPQPQVNIFLTHHRLLLILNKIIN